MKLTKLLLLAASTLLISGCNSEETISTSTTPAATSTSEAPKPVEFDLPTYKVVPSSYDMENTLISFDSAKKEFVVEYYDSLSNLKSGYKNTMKSYSVSYYYELAVNYTCNNNTVAAATLRDGSKFSVCYLNANDKYLTAIYDKKEDGKTVRKVLNLYKYEGSSIEGMTSIVSGKTFISGNKIQYWENQSASPKSAYFKAIFNGNLELKFSPVEDGEYDYFDQAALTHFCSYGLIDKENGVRISEYKNEEGHETIKIEKYAVSDYDSFFNPYTFGAVVA